MTSHRVNSLSIAYSYSKWFSKLAAESQCRTKYAKQLQQERDPRAKEATSVNSNYMIHPNSNFPTCNHMHNCTIQVDRTQCLIICMYKYICICMYVIVSMYLYVSICMYVFVCMYLYV